MSFFENGESPISSGVLPNSYPERGRNRFFERDFPFKDTLVDSIRLNLSGTPTPYRPLTNPRRNQ